MNAYTEHLPDQGEFTPTVCYKLEPSKLTDEERALIADKTFGYCETHRLLYRRRTDERPFGVSDCIFPSIFEDIQRSSCKEW